MRERASSDSIGQDLAQNALFTEPDDRSHVSRKLPMLEYPGHPTSLNLGCCLQLPLRSCRIRPGVHELDYHIAVDRVRRGEHLFLTARRKRLEVGEVRELACEPSRIHLREDGNAHRLLLFLDARHAKSLKTHEAYERGSGALEAGHSLIPSC